MEQKYNVVIVEDNEIIAKQIKGYLINENITNEIWSAKTGKEACYLIDKNNPELVLLNLQMPDMYGFEVVKKYKDNNIKFIIVTGFTDMETIKTAKDLKTLGIINKPFNYECFSQKLKELLSKKSNDSEDLIKPIEHHEIVSRKRFWKMFFNR